MLEPKLLELLFDLMISKLTPIHRVVNHFSILYSIFQSNYLFKGFFYFIDRNEAIEKFFFETIDTNI